MGTSYSATVSESVVDAKKELTNFIRQLESVPRDVLEQEAPRLLGEAKRETPRDTGRLEKSVRVRVSKSKRNPGLRISASARKDGENYAGIQHDNIYFKHPVKGKAHYLSDPFNRATKRIKKRLDKEVHF